MIRSKLIYLSKSDIKWKWLYGLSVGIKGFTPIIFMINRYACFITINYITTTMNNNSLNIASKTN